MKLGIVGYSSGGFDEAKAHTLLVIGLAQVEGKSKKLATSIVSGLTNVGIPALAYKLATDYKLETVGIACDKAFEYDRFPVDKQIIVGEDWGDESKTFLNYCDALLRVGGSEQSLAEVKAFKELKPGAVVVEFELPREESND
jgi:hypothetical protein